MQPTFSALIESLLVCSKQFGSVLVVFDAFDECGESEQQDILSIIAQFVISGIAVCVTTRPHFVTELKQIADAAVLEIRVHESNIRKYLHTRLEIKSLSDQLKTNIIEALSPRAQGMYTLLFGSVINWL